MFVLSKGYVVALVNYRGSTGFGSNSLLSLPGKIGYQDVLDVHRVSQSLVSGHKDLPFTIDKTKVCITGGSHGGFLTCHLIGQYPDYYKAAVTRNPVCHIPAMAAVSDIPDWCYVESGLPYMSPPSEDALLAMYRVSPIIHVHKVITPTLILLGSKDRRVPPFNGMDFYHSLLIAKTPSRLIVYPEDVHALDGIGAESGGCVNSILWFNKYCNI